MARGCLQAWGPPPSTSAPVESAHVSTAPVNAAVSDTEHSMENVSVPTSVPVPVITTTSVSPVETVTAPVTIAAPVIAPVPVTSPPVVSFAAPAIVPAPVASVTAPISVAAPVSAPVPAISSPAVPVVAPVSAPAPGSTVTSTSVSPVTAAVTATATVATARDSTVERKRPPYPFAEFSGDQDADKKSRAYIKRNMTTELANCAKEIHAGSVRIHFTLWIG